MLRRNIEVIAECGINHNGDMRIATKMIKKAKEMGADVAKFQLFNAERLIEEINPNLPEINKHWVRKTELSKDDLAYLSKTCDEHNIEFMSSVFEADLVDWLEEIGVKRYKVPAFLAVDYPLCNSVYSTGKEVIISHNSSYSNPVYFRWGLENVKRLYCVSNYPTKLGELDFYLDMFVDDYTGFSDHTVGITAPVAAMSLGARIIEKHFTLDVNMDGPDHRCSATVVDLWDICRFRDGLEILLYKKES